MLDNLNELKIDCKSDDNKYFLYIEWTFAELTESEDFSIMLYLYGESESLLKIFFNIKGCYLSSFYTTRLYLLQIDKNTLDLFLLELGKRKIKYKNIPLKILGKEYVR